MRNLAIIPARSGSKGLADKNIKDLCGKPMLVYTIEAALKANVFEEVMVSTDSEYYAIIAKKNGAKVPFLRSDKNSTDNSSSWDVVYETISNYYKQNRIFDTFMLLQPTSPLRDEKDICGAISEYKEKDACAVVSVCEAEHSPVYMNILPESLDMGSFFGDYKWTRRQDLPKYYRLNGAIYMSDVGSFMKYKDIYREKCFAYIMSRMHSVDIDSDLDFLYAETIINNGGRL